MKSVDLSCAVQLVKQFMNLRSVADAVSDDAAKIIGRLTENSFQVAIVGEFSSGKSTFLNALIKRDLLNHGRKDTTATITKLINTPLSSEKHNTCVVTFENGSTKLLSELGTLKEFTTTASKIDVAREIKCVEVYTHIFDSEQQIILIDTPGLNGTAEHHRDRTIDLVKSAHACIYLLQARGLAKTDYESLQLFTQYQQDFIFVQNSIDTFDGESVEEHLAEQEELLRSRVFADKPDARYSICGVSSLKALCAKDLDVNYLYEDDTEPLNEKRRSILYEESRFDSVLSLLNGLIHENTLHSLQQMSAIHSAILLIERVTESLVNDAAEQNAIWEHSKDARFVNRLQNILDGWDKRQEENCNSLANLVVAKFIEETRIVGKEIDDYIEVFRQDVCVGFNAIRSVDELEEYIKANNLTVDINNHRDFLNKKLKERLNISIAAVQNTAIARVQKYTELGDELPEIKEYKAKYNIKQAGFTEKESTVDYLQKSLSAEMSGIKEAKSAVDRAEEERRAALFAKTLIEVEKQKADKMHKYAVNSLGAMPSAQTKYRKETTTVERGGWVFGKIADFIAGQKSVTRDIPYQDYTEQQNWQVRRENISNEYNKETSKLRERISYINNKIAEAENDRVQALHDVQSKQNSAARARELLEAKKAELITVREKAASEYISNYKTSFRNQLDEYIEDNLAQGLKDYVIDETENVKEEISEEIIVQYKKAAEKQMERLQSRLSSSKSKPSNDIEQDINIMIEIRDSLQLLLKEANVHD